MRLGCAVFVVRATGTCWHAAARQGPWPSAPGATKPGYPGSTRSGHHEDLDRLLLGQLTQVIPRPHCGRRSAPGSAGQGGEVEAGTAFSAARSGH